MSNLFKGKTYEGTSFIFDKIYNNYKEMEENASKDGVLIGRYVLVQYCKNTLPADIRLNLESKINTDPSLLINQDEKDYLINRQIDYEYNVAIPAADRKVFRKTYKDNKYIYQEITSLNINVTNESINNLIIWHNF